MIMTLLKVLVIVISINILRSLDIYVSIDNGNDNNALKAQSPSYPLKTLHKTQEIIQNLQIRGNKQITVNIDGGIYEESLYFTNKNSRDKDNGYIVWKPWNENKKVTISGGKQINLSSFYSCSSPFDVNSNIELLCANLSSLGITNVGEMKSGTLGDCQLDKMQLFYNGIPQILSRWPNIDSNTDLFQYTTISSIVNSETFIYNNTDAFGIKYWSQEQDGWLHGYWSQDWADTYAPITQIEFKNNEYYITSNNFNYAPKTNARFYAVNMLSQIDTKTEYYVDKKDLILYWYPPEDMNNLNDNIVVSMEEYVILLNSSASHLSFENLSILYSRNSGISSKGNYLNNINITNCILSNHGNYGINIQGTNINIKNNSITYIGCVGLEIGGGDYKTLTPSNNLIYNNNIYNFARWKRTYMPGIHWSGVGMMFSYNNVTYGPHIGIEGEGCNTLFEYNYIKNTSFEVDDSGAFYSDGQDEQGWIRRGNIAKYNTFQNIRNLVPCTIGGLSIQAIYLDDQMSGWTLVNNTFINCQTGMFVGGGRRTTIHNNYCLDCDYCVHVDDRGLNWESSTCTPPNGDLWEGLYAINYTYPPWSTAYPEIVNIPNQQPCVPVFNDIENNEWCGNNTRFADFSEDDAVKWNDTLKNNVYKCH